MSRGEMLRAAAVATTGDPGIVDVAEFMPQAVADGMALNPREDRRPRHDATHDPVAAAHLGEDLAAERTELPPHVCLAVSGHSVYVLGIPHGFWTAHPEEAYLMGTFARERLEVDVKGRLTDLLVTLTDTDSGAVVKLVADRLSAYHPKALVELLRMGPSHVEAD